jgi:hypothetical protein
MLQVLLSKMLPGKRHLPAARAYDDEQHDSGADLEQHDSGADLEQHDSGADLEQHDSGADLRIARKSILFEQKT